MELNERIKKIVNFFKIPRETNRRLAMKYLFSTLCDIEEIAVLASERGAGVEGQLEDEIVHREAFKQIANLCGGYEQTHGPIRDITEYLGQLEGDEAMAAINIVSEGWLGCIFEALVEIAPEVFISVGEDEARHNGYALGTKVPNSQKFQSIIRDLESMMVEISLSAEFLFPIAYLIGYKKVSVMGLNIAKSHINACLHLDIPYDVREFVKWCKSASIAHRNFPKELPITIWETDKQKLWPFPQDIIITNTITIPGSIGVYNPIKTQAKFIHAIGRIMSLEPKFRRVTRDQKIFQTDRMMVGFRHWFDDEKYLKTLYVNARNDYKKIVKNMIWRIKTAMRRELKSMPDMYNLRALLPPAQFPIVMSWSLLIEQGYTGISEIEGNSLTVYISKPVIESDKYIVTLVGDHRVHDGKDLFLFHTLLNQFLQEEV